MSYSIIYYTREGEQYTFSFVKSFTKVGINVMRIHSKTHCSCGKIPDDSTDIGVMGVKGVGGAGVIGLSGKGDIPL